MTRILIGFIGAHSCVLGLAMLFAPSRMTALLGFTADIPVFFPSQSGVFLLILGLCYLYALENPAFTKVILVSKAFAVVFLAVHAGLLSAPPMVWAAAAGDAAMLGVLAASLLRDRRAERG
jgi:hypothetical protein